MEEKEEILNVLMKAIGEEGCGVSCEEAEVFKDEEGWKMFFGGFHGTQVYRKNDRRGKNQH